jgi:glutamine transport system permease protein
MRCQCKRNMVFKVTYFNDSDTLYNDVINGNAQATFGDLPVIQYAVKNGTQLKVMNSKSPIQAGWYGLVFKRVKMRSC